MKGLTAQYLLRRTYMVARGECILVHAAAGGVGLLLCQWGKALGAKVIGRRGMRGRRSLRTATAVATCAFSGTDDVLASVRRITRDQGVSVVYDAVGKDTFTLSLDCLRPLGMMVTVRQCLRSGAASQSAGAGQARLAVPHASDAVPLHRDARRSCDAAARELFARRSENRNVRVGSVRPIRWPMQPGRTRIWKPAARPARAF